MGKKGKFIVNNAPQPKVSKSGSKIHECRIKKEELDTMFFSFKYLTKDDNHNFCRFMSNGDIRQNLSTINEMHKKFYEMSIEGWNGMRQFGKKQGGKEKLSYSDIYFKAYDPKSELELSGDSKIQVYRFGGRKYRLLGYKGKKCHSVLYIIGFDFDFSAYDHEN